MKFLCTLEDNPVLHSLNEQRIADNKELEERQKFLQKQFDNLKKDAEEKAELFWVSIKKSLKEKKLLPEDYSPENYCLTLDEGQIMLYTAEEYGRRRGGGGGGMSNLLSILQNSGLNVRLIGPPDPDEPGPKDSG